MTLHLGHRQSVDFDFFSNQNFNPADLISTLPYLKMARIDQRGDNTLTALLEGEGPVKVSFFGDVDMNRVHTPEIVTDHGLQIASLLDLTATKLKTIQLRAEAKDLATSLQQWMRASGWSRRWERLMPSTAEVSTLWRRSKP